jgi:Cdc6-like AAA superfamily ATPase
LEHRTDAFADNVLDGDIIPKVAALVAKEHGDTQGCGYAVRGRSTRRKARARSGVY